MAIHEAITRRDFMNGVGMGTAALLAGVPQTQAAPGMQGASDAFEPDLALELIARPRNASLRPGRTTSVWSYQSRMLKGDPTSVQALPDSYLGPILRLRRGQKVRIDFINRLDQPSTVHWHGLHVPDTMDGHPRFAIGPGERYRYEFEVRNRAGTYWYHPHPHGHTGEQVYFGLAGLLLVSDGEEQTLPLPRGQYDVPIVIQDRSFDDDNQFRYLGDTGPTARGNASGAPSAPGNAMGGRGMMGGMMSRGAMMSGGMGGMMARMMGFLGDTILVNGRPDASIEVATHPYRLRILNGSNSRIYKLAWQDGRPLTVIGTDGGLLERPVHKDYVMLAPAERVELWADFSKDDLGTQLTLMSLAFEGSMGGMMGMMDGGPMAAMMDNSSLAAGAQFPIFKVNVARKTNARLELPERLSAVSWPRLQDAVNRAKPRAFRITMAQMQWGFDGRGFEMMAVAPNEVVKLGTTEVWEFANDSGMMTMAHPIHVHDPQFQVLERRHGAASGGVRDGYVDQGWKDTVLVMPGDRVKLLMRFADYPGLYLYHCHMLEHEDLGLMRNYRIET
ncbi:multicopper oxidase family protein [Alicycliphilus denitrificans]|uniref:multicopper oxidase family protein n=1 Tax=Alicycliphilus denitrificans TaxID=179636 RepID=UPI0001D9E3C3|nr:multicopper oxidase domain-containing protein [Alicycliphilus denitrificans]ADV00476.1 Bilirubin oxidase [Alicycliphilus denitrificans BC]